MNDRERLDRLGITPKKSLGQNFLHDPNMLEKIVELAQLQPGAAVLEIGPGTGNLTRLLAREAAHLVAVELDDRLVPLLREAFADQPHVEIVHADILALNAAELMNHTPYKVVANLPYYITSAILRHLLEASQRPQRLVITVQREVAERIVAEPGEMSILAVSVQFYGRAEIALRLNPALFWPRPEVESAVVCIDVFDQPTVDVPDRALFFRIVRAGFSQKRKQLRNALSGGLQISKAEADALLLTGDVNPQRRAETLSLTEWAAITRAAAGTNAL